MGWPAGLLLVLLLSPASLAPLRDVSATVLGAVVCFGVASTAVRARDRERVLMGLGIGGAVFAALLLLVVTPASPAPGAIDLVRVTRWLSIPCALGLAGLLVCAPHGRRSRWSVTWFCVLSVCGAAIATWGTPDTTVALGATGLWLTLPCLRLRGRVGVRAARRHSIAVWGALATLLCVAGSMLLSGNLGEPGLVLGAAAIAGLACPTRSRRLASEALWAGAHTGPAPTPVHGESRPS